MVPCDAEADVLLQSWGDVKGDEGDEETRATNDGEVACNYRGIDGVFVHLGLAHKCSAMLGLEKEDR
jgi:hypothetical protein